MTPVSRDSVAGRVYLDLQARARSDGRPTDELLVLYVLERFLFRLSQSPHRHHLILKGGMLLAALDERRPTADVDLLARVIDNDVEIVSALVAEILAVDVDDGVEFALEDLRAEVIREADLYAGIRIVVPARIARARHPLRVDVNVGDPVTPAPVDIDYPSLLGDSFSLRGYPLPTVLAEKIVTMVERGDTTTRERDFADVYLLTARHAIEGDALVDASDATAAHRQADLRPLRTVLVTLGGERQADWERFINRAGLADTLPTSYSGVIEAIAEFADSIFAGSARGRSWDPGSRTWR